MRPAATPRNSESRQPRSFSCLVRTIVSLSSVFCLGFRPLASAALLSNHLLVNNVHMAARGRKRKQQPEGFTLEDFSTTAEDAAGVLTLSGRQMGLERLAGTPVPAAFALCCHLRPTRSARFSRSLTLLHASGAHLRPSNLTNRPWKHGSQQLWTMPNDSSFLATTRMAGGTAPRCGNGASRTEFLRQNIILPLVCHGS